MERDTLNKGKVSVPKLDLFATSNNNSMSSKKSDVKTE
jgi:hypothetical protein